MQGEDGRGAPANLTCRRTSPILSLYAILAPIVSPAIRLPNLLLCCGASVALLVPAVLLPGLGRSEPEPAVEAVPADLDRLTPEQEAVVLAQRKRIMGRVQSLEHVRRVSGQVRPLVEAAVDDPALAPLISSLAAASAVSPRDYRDYFVNKQEADLLLESGGDPEARSRSNAIGVAQFMAGTGRARGLRVDLRESDRLSGAIASLDRQIKWLQAQAPGWRKPPPAPLRGRTAGPWDRERWLSHRLSQRNHLAAKRRRVDERFDPQKAIRVQTRYLLELTARFGGVDWALQAYHGGEGGVMRTLALFGDAAGGSMRLASRGARGVFNPSPYSGLYGRLSPSGTPAAFNYVYGRSDDHRNYWWKVLMAERALALYRRDPEGFERQWAELRPGMGLEASWYPDLTSLVYTGAADLRAAYAGGALVALAPRVAARLGLRTANLAVLDPPAAPLHKGLRPEAMGALLSVAQTYRSNGGRELLVVPQMVQSAAYRARWTARYPPPPLPPDVPRDPDFAPTGLVFHLRPPARDWDRKVLEFALGRLYDSHRITWRQVTVAGSRRFHVAVNPAYREELAAAGRRLSG